LRFFRGITLDNSPNPIATIGLPVINNGLPVVSIGLPVFNEANWVRRSLDSLLNQTYKDFELIIADNASDDATGEICMEYAAREQRIQYCRHESNIGANNNFRHVAGLARGKYFMWAAADDWWEPDFVETLVGELETHPETGLAMTSLNRHWDDGTHLNAVRFEGERDPNNMTFFHLAINMIAAGITQYHYFIYGLYRTDFLKSALAIPIPDVPVPDRLFMTQVALATKIRYVDKFLHIRTVHHTPSTERLANEEYIKIGNTDKMGYTRTWLAIEPYLWASRVIPSYRKHLIPIIADTFARTNRTFLYQNDKGDKSPQAHHETGDEDLSVINQLRNAGHITESHKIASALASEDQGDIDLLNLLGEIKLQINHDDCSKNILLDVIKSRPDDSRALKNLAILSWRGKTPDEALTFARRAVEADKNHADAHIVLGRILAELGKSDEAAAYLQRALRIRPDNIDALKGIAVVSLKSNNLKKAQEFLKKAQKISPGDSETRALLSQVQDRMEQRAGH
jgi:glycosyltransferase involved in cell wall biosynthesis/Tfp pilus assembly protein PilF